MATNFNMSKVLEHYTKTNQEAIAAMPLDEQMAFFEAILTLEGMGAENSVYTPDPDFIFMEKMEKVSAVKEKLEADISAYSKACEDYYSFLAMMDMDKFLSICKNSDRPIDRKMYERSFEVEKTLERWRA